MNKVVRERFKVIRERFRGLRRELKLKEVALKIQRKEYKRRLRDLNHEAARIKESQSMSISVERFEGHVVSQNQKFETLIKAVKELSDKSKENQGRAAWTERYLPWGLTIILTVIALWLAYYRIKMELL